MEKVRVRFAPSPTGALHIGGVRTALFNYLFAKHHKGDFILRIEDTDRKRYVTGSEDYILKSLEWLGIIPDESPFHSGDLGPYRQSERKSIYKLYVDQLLSQNKAYYAFDTNEQLDNMRTRLESEGMINFNYNATSRMQMTNSLTLSSEEVKKRIDDGVPYVVRLKLPLKKEISFKDVIRGWVHTNSMNLDDKVIMKSDGLPTYHLANVVDDHLMKVTHVIRGEEWIPSASFHVLLYDYLGWANEMPQFAHLPLILKPNGNGKLSKRFADKAGIPIFIHNWTDPTSNMESIGFRELGYDPGALINFLAFQGWNPGNEKELFSKKELIREFNLGRVGKAGTRFDIDKLKWYNLQYLRAMDSGFLAIKLAKDLQENDIICDHDRAKSIVELLKPRVSFYNELVSSSKIFFMPPTIFDKKVIRKKWDEESKEVLLYFAEQLIKVKNIDSATKVKEFWMLIMNSQGYSAGKYMQILRLSITGLHHGADLMEIINILGVKATSEYIQNSVKIIENQYC